MFSFFHRKSKIILECFTTEPQVYQFTPVTKSSKTIPEWWKNLPNETFFLKRNDQGFLQHQDNQNLKNCYGFLEYFSNSICVRHWTDIYIQTTKDNYEYYYSSGLSPESHSRKQIGKGFDDYHHIKLMSPWFFREKTGVKFLSMGAEWNLDKFHFTVLPGVIEFRVNGFTNINIMLPKEEKSFIIPVNQPLWNLFPLSDKSIIVKNNLITQEEMNRIKFNPGISYFHGWRSCENMIQKNEKKCPFGFGE